MYEIHLWYNDAMCLVLKLERGLLSVYDHNPDVWKNCVAAFSEFLSVLVAKIEAFALDLVH